MKINNIFACIACIVLLLRVIDSDRFRHVNGLNCGIVECNFICQMFCCWLLVDLPWQLLLVRLPREMHSVGLHDDGTDSESQNALFILISLEQYLASAAMDSHLQVADRKKSTK